MNRTFLALLFAACSAPLGAQQGPFRTRDYLPTEYTNLIAIDLKAMRATGLWDEMSAGLMETVVSLVEREAGVQLEAIDRLTLVPFARPADAEGQRPEPAFHQVMVLEGNRELPEPDWVTGSESYVPARIGEHEVKRREAWRDEIFLRPQPETWVVGDTSLLEPILRGETGAGVPSAQLLALTAGAERPLFTVVVHLPEAPEFAPFLKEQFAAHEWPADGEPEYLRVRLVAAGDPDDPEFVFEALLRHPGGAGVGVSGKALDQLLEQAGAMQELRLFRPLLQKLERASEGSDLSLTLKLGRGRQAAGQLAMVLAPMFALTAAPDAPPVKAEPAVPVKKK